MGYVAATARAVSARATQMLLHTGVQSISLVTAIAGTSHDITIKCKISSALLSDESGSGGKECDNRDMHLAHVLPDRYICLRPRLSDTPHSLSRNCRPLSTRSRDLHRTQFQKFPPAPSRREGVVLESSRAPLECNLPYIVRDSRGNKKRGGKERGAGGEKIRRNLWTCLFLPASAHVSARA